MFFPCTHSHTHAGVINGPGHIFFFLVSVKVMQEWKSSLCFCVWISGSGLTWMVGYCTKLILFSHTCHCSTDEFSAGFTSCGILNWSREQPSAPDYCCANNAMPFSAFHIRNSAFCHFIKGNRTEKMEKNLKCRPCKNILDAGFKSKVVCFVFEKHQCFRGGAQEC